MHVDIIIVSYNTSALLHAALDSINRHLLEKEHVHVYVVDNASADDSTDMVTTQFPDTHLIALDKNIGFGPANNEGIRAGSAPYLLFMNSDAELTPLALDQLHEFMEQHPDCVIAGPSLINPDGSFQPSCRRLPTPLRNFWHISALGARFPDGAVSLQNWFSEAEHTAETPVEMVSGACFIARRDYMESIGLFDEDVFMYEEEMDISLPAHQQGKTVGFCPGATIIHHGGASVESATMSEFSSRHLFRSKYYCFRKHYGSTAALFTYWIDKLLFTKSLVWQTVTGKHPDKKKKIASCKRGWKDSFIPLSTLMDDKDFFT